MYLEIVCIRMNPTRGYEPTNEQIMEVNTVNTQNKRFLQTTLAGYITYTLHTFFFYIKKYLDNYRLGTNLVPDLANDIFDVSTRIFNKDNLFYGSKSLFDLKNYIYKHTWLVFRFVCIQKTSKRLENDEFFNSRKSINENIKIREKIGDMRSKTAKIANRSRGAKLSVFVVRYIYHIFCVLF